MVSNDGTSVSIAGTKLSLTSSDRKRIVLEGALQQKNPDEKDTESNMDADEFAREATKAKILEMSEWLDADRIESLRSDCGMQPVRMIVRMIDAWEEEKRIFSLSPGEKKLYARYQLDSDYFPLPIIGEILLALSGWNDGWKVASWFAFANGWIAAPGSKGARSLAPKDALSQPEQLLIAAANAGGTYVA